MKRFAMAILAFVFVFVLLLPLAANAQEKSNYIVGKLGFYSPTGDLDDLEFDTGFNGQIAFGHYFHKNFALEGGIGYVQTDSDLSGLDWEGSAIPITVTAKGILPLDTVELYAGVGIGLYFASLEVTVPGFPSVDDDDTVFGSHLTLGANFDFSESVFFGVEGTYVITGEAEFFDDPEGVSFDGFTLTGSVGYRF